MQNQPELESIILCLSLRNDVSTLPFNHHNLHSSLALLHGLHLILNRDLCLLLLGHDISDLQAGLLLDCVQPIPDTLFGLILQVVDVLCRRVEKFFALVLPTSPVLCEGGSVFLFDLGVVFSEVGGEVWVEVVQADYECEGRGEQSNRKSAVAGEDGTGKSGDTDVKEAGGEGLGGGYEGFDFAFDGSLDVDPAIDERADRVARVGGEVRERAAGGTDLSFELGLHGYDFHLGIRLRVDRKL